MARACFFRSSAHAKKAWSYTISSDQYSGCFDGQTASQGVDVFFLPKFHCELTNFIIFIEQCGGRGKSVYRTYPPSSREEDLMRNTLLALDSVPLAMMRKFAIRSRRFTDAYDKGLNGKQAEWALRKYRGHRVLCCQTSKIY